MVKFEGKTVGLPCGKCTSCKNEQAKAKRYLAYLQEKQNDDNYKDHHGV